MTKHDIYVPIESPGDLRILHALLKEAGEPVNALDAYAMDNFGKYESGVDINTLNVQNLSFWNGRWILTSVKGEKKITPEELRSLLLPDFKYVGKWLKGYGPYLMYITSGSPGGSLYGCGIDYKGQWADYTTPGAGLCALNHEAKQHAREATYLEVKDALIGQAKKRGFDKESFSIKEAVHPTFTRECTPGGSFILTSDGKTLFYGGVVLFHEGKWAELKEEDKFSELKEKPKVGDVVKMETKDPDNCLSSSLRQWARDPSLVLYYNSDHVISLHPGSLPPAGYLHLQYYGYVYFKGSFGHMMSKREIYLLKEYLKTERND